MPASRRRPKARQDTQTRDHDRERSQDEQDQNLPPDQDPSVFMHTEEEEFQPGRDPNAERLREAESDPRIERFSRNPGPIDPNANVTPVQQPDGSWKRPTSDNVGRPTHVPLWEHAHIYPAVTQLRVWRNVNGNLHEIGAITCKASMDQFIETFWPSMPKEGEQAALFEARAMDSQGNFQDMAFPVGPIDANHLTLRQMRIAKSSVAGPYVPPPVVPPGLDLNLLKTIKEMFVDPALEVAREARADAKLAEQARANESKTIADERIDLARNTGATVEVMSSKLMDSAAAADARRAQEQRDLYAEQRRLDAADRERERERYAAERKERDDEAKRRREDEAHQRKLEAADREEQRRKDREEAEERRKDRENEYAQRMAEEKARHDRDLERERAREADRRAEDERRWEREKADARARETERENDRRRQHDEAIAAMNLRAQQDREHSLAMAALAKHDSPEGAIGSLNKMLTPLGLNVQELAGPFIQKMLAPESEFDIAGLVEGVGKIGVDALGKIVDYAKVTKQIEAQKQGGHPALNPQVITVQPTQQGGGGGAPQQQTGTQPATTQGPAPSGTPVNENQNVASNLPLDMQRSCRASLRQGIIEMQQDPTQGKWKEIVERAFASEPGLYHWFKQLTIRGALRDIQVDPQFIDLLLQHPALAHPLLADVPRG